MSDVFAVLLDRLDGELWTIKRLDTAVAEDWRMLRHLERLGALPCGGIEMCNVWTCVVAIIAARSRHHPASVAREGGVGVGAVGVQCREWTRDDLSLTD